MLSIQKIHKLYLSRLLQLVLCVCVCVCVRVFVFRRDANDLSGLREWNDCVWENKATAAGCCTSIERPSDSIGDRNKLPRRYNKRFTFGRIVLYCGASRPAGVGQHSAQTSPRSSNWINCRWLPVRFVGTGWPHLRGRRKTQQSIGRIDFTNRRWMRRLARHRRFCSSAPMECDSFYYRLPVCDCAS